MSLKRIFKKRLSKKILSGVDMVKLGVLDRLAETFQGRYGNETADSLAAAVVNELFSETPSDRYAKRVPASASSGSAFAVRFLGRKAPRL